MHIAQKEVTASVPLKDKVAKTYTVAQVKANNGTNGVSWTVAYNKVYDITTFIPKHPGGDIVRICAGRDATDLMESYHPSAGQAKAMKWLDDYYIGDLEVPSKFDVASGMAVATSLPDDKFFVTVRSRVEKRLKEIGWGRHFYEPVAMFEVIVSVLLYFYASYMVGATSSYGWAAFAGLLTGRLGFIMHMGNHRGISSNATINTIVESTMDLIGGSSRIWSYEHAVAHHLTPNQLWTDNDCSIGEPHLRFHPGIAWKPIHRIQAPATLIAMTIGTLKWYFSDVINFFQGYVGSQTIALTRGDWIQMALFKGFWFILHVLFPWIVSGSLSFALTSALLLMGISSHYLENIFIVNHIQDGLVPDPTEHWAVQQVKGTANWASGSYFWNFFSGGLNHQIEHHLFPSISQYCYPAIAPVVKQTCKEFNIPYIDYGNLPNAWWKTYTYLHRLGYPPTHPEHLSMSVTQPAGHPAIEAAKGAVPQAKSPASPLPKSSRKSTKVA